MKRWRIVALSILCCGLLTGAAGCPLTQPDANGRNPLQKTGQRLTEIAPAVPGPWGIVAGAAGAVLMGIGSIFGAKAKAKAIEEVGTVAAVNPWLKVAADRRWLFPTLGALVAIGNAAGLWALTSEQLWSILGMLGMPAALEFAKDARGAPPPAGSPG